MEPDQRRLARGERLAGGLHAGLRLSLRVPRRGLRSGGASGEDRRAEDAEDRRRPGARPSSGARGAPRAGAPGPGPTGGAYTAVLGSYSVSANAKGASDRLDRSLASQMAGHRKALTAATVKGTSYTVLTVSGFATAGEAGAFCTSARGIGLECFAKRTATP